MLPAELFPLVAKLLPAADLGRTEATCRALRAAVERAVRERAAEWGGFGTGAVERVAGESWAGLSLFIELRAQVPRGCVAAGGCSRPPSTWSMLRRASRQTRTTRPQPATISTSSTIIADFMTALGVRALPRFRSRVPAPAPGASRRNRAAAPRPRARARPVHVQNSQ